MRWNTSSYELPDGTPVSGDIAAVARALDDFDPLSYDERNVLTESQTRAELLHFLDDFRWCAETGTAILKGVRDMWREADESEVYSLVTSFLSARVMWANAAAASADPADPAAKKRAVEYLKFAKKGDTIVTARRMLDDAKMHRLVAVSDLNRGSRALGTPSGVLLLDEMAVRADAEEAEAFQHDRPVCYSLSSLNVTKTTKADVETDFVPQSFEHVDRWDTFIDEICDGDREKASFLRRALGYSLIGGNPEKATFVLWGPTRDNGKSTLMNAVKLALGDYAGTAPAGLLLVNRNESYTAANPVLAGLPGKRLVDVSEPPAGTELNGAMVKKLASGTDPVSCRQLHHEEFTYVPDFTLWMHCNALPVVRDPSAIDTRHMFVIEFTRSFGPDEQDPGLWDEITSPEGMNTILEWLLDGYDEWCERRLDPPACVTEATQAWLFTSMTWLDRFISEMCVMGVEETCPIADFRQATAAWCAANDCEALTAREVNRRLKEMNVRYTTSNGTRLYRGIGLLPAAKLWTSHHENGSSGRSEDEITYETPDGNTHVRLI